MDYIINHKKIKKKFNSNELIKYLNKENKIVKFPHHSKGYHNFFSTYAKKNYKLVNNNCLCGEKNDILLSQTDRHFVDFITVVCKSCGLIRAKDYFRNEDVRDFYKNFYLTYYDYYQKKTPADLFKDGKINSKFKYDLLNKYKIKPLNNIKIVDLGGGVGGVLDHFDKSILSHVIEHWNNFEFKIQKLINVQKINHTLNYIEFPGVDSLKKGRREGDILGDIHVPHVYYFTSYVFENLMNRYGFEKIYLDTLIKSIFIYTGKKRRLINNFKLCKIDLIHAERTRKIQIFKNLIKFIIPTFILRILRKINSKNIKF